MANGSGSRSATLRQPARIADDSAGADPPNRQKLPDCLQASAHTRPGDALTLVRGLADQGVDGILLCFDFGKPFTAAHYRRWQDREFQATTCRILEACRRHLTGATALLTNGGVYCRQDYRDRLQAGADLVQLHNALVFEGPAIGWQISP